ncbi:hypothetical protein IIC38_14775 [candidate division KSB1 bacterium]|nr:hypothetical protein [candidate division KSB1 bacterium]
MKPDNQDNDLFRGRRILQILERSIPEKEGTKPDRKSKISTEEMQEISMVLELSGPRQGLRLPDEYVEKIAEAITKTAGNPPLRKPTVARRLGFGLLAAAVLTIALFQLYEPKQPTNLDWEATEFHTISYEIELASVLLTGNAWFEESQSNVVFSQNTNNALLDAKLHLSKLESSLFDSLFILNQ